MVRGKRPCLTRVSSTPSLAAPVTCSPKADPGAEKLPNRSSPLLLRVEVHPQRIGQGGEAGRAELEGAGQGLEGLLGQPGVAVLAGLDPQPHQVGGGGAVGGRLGAVVLVLGAREQLLVVAGGVEEGAALLVLV